MNIVRDVLVKIKNQDSPQIVAYKSNLLKNVQI